MKYSREYLEEGRELYLSPHRSGDGTDQYIIKGVVGEGGSAVCYDAVRLRNGGMETGRLKEFYPAEREEDRLYEGDNTPYYSLIRLADGRLIAGRGTERSFGGMCSDFADSYRILNEIIASDKHNEVLNSYIPYGEVLYASRSHYAQADTGEEVQSTVYVWSAGISGEGYDVYLDRIRKNPADNPDLAVYEILRTVRMLCDCMYSMHCAGLVHLDIKPSNIFIPSYAQRQFGAGSISLVDINSIHYVNSRIPVRLNSDGFSAPETRRGGADERADLYSVGAILFYALVVSKSVPDGLYRDELYHELPYLLQSSELLRNAGAGSDGLFLKGLLDVLMKCLAPNRERRYSDTGLLLKDMDKLLKRAFGYSPEVQMYIQQQSGRADSSRKNVSKDVNDATIVIQKLLYDHPLYQHLDDEIINVLVVGAGKYGQRFIDLSLQVSQMKDTRVAIDAFSDDPAAYKEAYLQFRPAVSGFVNVDGSLDGSGKESYGSVDFTSVTDEDGACKCFIKREPEQNAELVKRIVGEAADIGIQYDYVFVALGDFMLNRRIAALLYDAVNADENHCTVCYISDRPYHDKRTKGRAYLYPIDVTGKITLADIDPRLEERAFNVHNSWLSTLNMDYNASLLRFRSKKYDYHSSVSYVLSIPYKLQSVGISESNIEQAGERFYREVVSRLEEQSEAGSRARETLLELAALEHRRWVLEKVCDGWQAPMKGGKLDFAGCITECAVRNEARRLHPCILRSTAAAPLRSAAFQEDGRKKWERTDIFAELDELDAMSVKLHQTMKQRADRLRRENPLYCDDMEAIQKQLARFPDPIMRAFGQYRFCLQNILDGTESYTRQYDSYLEAFHASLAPVPAHIREDIRERTARIGKLFFPIIEANLYRDYKANDEVLIRKIPFIIAYRHIASLTLAFEDGRGSGYTNHAVFPTVASASVLYPQKIIYLYYFSRQTDAAMLLEKIRGVFRYFNSRQMMLSAEFTVCFDSTVQDDDRIYFETAFEQLRQTLVQAAGEKQATAFPEPLCRFSCCDEREAMEMLSDYLGSKNAAAYDGSTALFDSPLLTGEFAYRVRQSGMAYFEFDSSTKRFSQAVHCDYLRYLCDDSFMKIADMFALINAFHYAPSIPELSEEYKALWSIYSGAYISTDQARRFAVTRWTDLCQNLAQYEESSGARITVRFDDLMTAPQTGYRFYLPSYVYEKADALLDCLKKCQLRNYDRSRISGSVISPRSTVRKYSSELCKLELVCSERIMELLSPLFRDPLAFLPLYDLKAEKIEEEFCEKLCIRYERMDVTRMLISSKNEAAVSGQCAVLRELENHRFISGLKTEAVPGDIAGCMVSFTYASPGIKGILTTSGKLLEIYAYYRILETGYFDDVIWSCEVDWNCDTKDGLMPVRNEFDLVLTKGFRSVLIECKSVKKMTEDYFLKFHSLATRFGISDIRVLLGNTYRNDKEFLAQSNRSQISRGNSLSIITVSEPEDVENIAALLVDMMKTPQSFTDNNKLLGGN